MIKNRKYTLLLPLLLIAGFIIAGAFHTWWYRGMPIVRNSLTYAQIIQAMIDYGSDFSVANHASNKALGFPYLSSPLVRVWGAGFGLKVSSFIWTSLWMITIWVWWRRMRPSLNVERNLSLRFPLPEGYMDAAFLVFVLLNPLVFYQFMSAYPDTLFSLSFLWSLYFLDRTLSRDIRWWDGVMFSFVLLFAIWVKHAGFIIFLILPLFVICRRSVLLFLWRERRKELITAIFAFTGFLIIIAFAQAGKIDLFNLGYNRHNYSEGEDRWSIISWNIFYLGQYVLYSFSSLVLLLLYWPQFKKHKEWYITLIIFIISILFYHGTEYNFRYYLPIAPIIVLIIMMNWTRLNTAWRRIFLLSFITINLFTIFFYNSLSFYSVAQYIVPLPLIDNLRLNREQLDRQESIDAINRLFNKGYHSLIFVSNYKGKMRWYVWERDGYFEKDLKIIYVLCWNKAVLEQEKLKQAIVYDDRELVKKDKEIEDRIRQVTRAVFLVEM